MSLTEKVNFMRANDGKKMCAMQTLEKESSIRCMRQPDPYIGLMP